MMSDEIQSKNQSKLKEQKRMPTIQVKGDSLLCRLAEEGGVFLGSPTDNQDLVNITETVVLSTTAFYHYQL